MPVHRIKKAFTKIPETLAQAAYFIAGIAQKQRAINEAKRNAKEKIDLITAELNKTVEPLKKERDNFFVALFAFAQPKKKEFTVEARSVKLNTGTFGWRWTPPYVSVTNGMSDDDLVAYLEKRGLSEYVRVIKEVDREALLRDRPSISFITYAQREEFFAKPTLLKGEGPAKELTTEAIDV